MLNVTEIPEIVLPVPIFVPLIADPTIIPEGLSIESEVDPGLFNALCCSGQYRQDQYSSPDNLKSMMPMYALKPGYILLIRVVKGLTGISEYQSMKYISLVSSLILAFIFFIAFFWNDETERALSKILLYLAILCCLTSLELIMISTKYSQ